MSLVKKLIEAGIRKQIADGNEREKSKVGTLRAGNTGMVDEKGRIIGSCAATTYLRMIGINGTEVDVNKELMFAGGRLNEDHWLSALKESYDGLILCEEDIPTSWETDNGIRVTGRPDVVLCSGENLLSVKSVCGIELKQCMSVNSAYNVLIKCEPQLKHLMQAAHYAWQLDCPFELWYTNRNNLDMPSWMEYRKFPPPGTPGTESLSYRYYRWGDINPKTNKPKKHQLTEAQYSSGEFERTFAQASKIKPFIKGFRLVLRDGILYYQDADTPDDEDNVWIKSIVSIDNIERFYNFVGDLEQYGKVPKQALNLTATGEMMGWTFGQYSDLGDLDPQYQAGRPLDAWVEAVKKKLAGDR